MYADPEQDDLYQKYWSQYPDNSDEAPAWLDQFRDTNDQIDHMQSHLPECSEVESDDEVWGDVPFYMYNSPERKPISRSEAVSTFNLGQLSAEASEIFDANKNEVLTLKTFREQIIYTVHLLRPENQPPLASFSQIGSIFGVKKGTIASHLSRGIEVNEQGRPRELTDSEINEIISFVYEKYFSKDPATFESILFFIKDRFDKDIIIKTLYGQLSRLPQLKTLEGVPMEDNRVNCSIESIEKYYNDLEQLLQSRVIPSAFIFNIDEAGFAERTDSANISVVVPADAKEDEIKVPIDRQGKRASLLAGISADGDTLTPAIVVHRKTIETELFENGYTPEKVCICYSESGFFSTDLYLKCAYEYFFPEVEKKREKYKYTGECILILNGFGPHDNDIFLDECSKNGIIPFFLPPHSSDQTQPLDIGIFAVQKTKMNRIFVPSGLSQQSSQLIKIIDSFRQTSTISNVISAFRGAGIVSSFDKEYGLVAKVDRSQAIKVRHWVNVRDETFNKKRIHL